LSRDLKGRDHLGDVVVEEGMILKCILKRPGRRSVNWIHLTQVR
jgi:hypothetical protein